MTWQSAWNRSGYAIAGVGCPAWSRKEDGQAGQLRKAFPGTTEEFHAFLNWVVGEWQTIMDGWGGQNRPSLPVVGYVLAARPRFFDIWAADKVEAFANDRSNDRVERLRARGMPEADAIITDAEIRERDRQPAPTHAPVGQSEMVTMQLKPRRKKKWIY